MRAISVDAARMNFYTETELASLFRGGESQLVEWKRSASDRRAIRRNICAFANDLSGAGKPGVIFVGVEDDGSCAEIDIDDALLRDLAQIHSDGSTQPIPLIDVGKASIEGCDVAVVQVAPSASPPVQYSKRVWVKVGPTVQEASEDEVQRLHDRRLGHEHSRDLIPVRSASLDDLDVAFIRDIYIPAAIPAEVLERNRRTLEQRLASLRLLVDGLPTWGALITMGVDPQRWSPGGYVQFLRIAGRELGDPILDQKALTGRIDHVLQALDELIRLNILVRTDISGPREVRFPDYPVQALQELGRNAVMHRAYSGTNAPTHFYWYEDRVEIRSPGGLYGRVTASNFGSGIVDYRNPLIAEVMYHLGFAQRFGLGVGQARESLGANGNPQPQFKFFDEQILATVWRAA